nr:hypothetical protein [Tanacetum cinerariifolium]GEZ62347.1 hypothetical protein [Tanacetum cinerariifolium]
LRYDGDECNKGRMPTKIELTLEQSQQGVSNDVLVSIEGVEDLKRNVWIKGEKNPSIHLKQKPGQYICYRFSLRSYALSWKPYQGDSLNLPDHRVNKDRKFTDDEIRSVGDKLKGADDKIKEGTLNLDDGTDAMTVMFGKEKGGYARGVESGVTYKRCIGQELSTEMTEKDVLVKKLSNEMTETKGMLSQLMNQLDAQGVRLNLSSQLQVASDVTPMVSYEVDETQSSVVVRDKDARIQKKSNGLVTFGKENNRLKTVKDGVGGFFAWPKNQVVLDEEVPPPTKIQKISDYNSAPKLQSKRKNYVSRETMQRQARTGNSHKSLNYGS